jgi:hypothetical protein
MSITFQKRQKEMKRQEKAREKATRRAEKKLAKGKDGENTNGAPVDPALDPTIDWLQKSEMIPIARNPGPIAEQYTQRPPSPRSSSGFGALGANQHESVPPQNENLRWSF